MIVAMFLFIGLAVVVIACVINASTIDDIEASIARERFDHGFGAPPSDQSQSLLVGRSEADASDHSTEAKS